MQDPLKEQVMVRSSAHLGCGLFSWLNLLTAVLVIMKLGGAIDLSWLAVTMPTWGPYVLIFALAWLSAAFGSLFGGGRSRGRVRRRSHGAIYKLFMGSPTPTRRRRSSRSR